MDYKQIYKQLILHALRNKPSGYTESHHILPRSWGGSNDNRNLVDLSPRQHFIAHRLLVKCASTGSRKYKMAKAVDYMMNDNMNTKHTPNSRTYNHIKCEFRILHRIKQVEFVGCDADVIPCGLLSSNINLPQIEIRRFLDTSGTTPSTYGCVSRMVGIALAAYKLGYTKLGGIKNYNLIEKYNLFIKCKVGNHAIYTFSDKLLAFCRDYKRNIPINIIYDFLIIESYTYGKGMRGMSEFRNKVNDYNHSHNSKLITIKYDKKVKDFYIRKMNKWVGDLPDITTNIHRRCKYKKG